VPRLLVSILLALLALLLPRAVLAADLPMAPERCDTVELGGETASCDDARCILSGKAYLFCDGLRVWADELEVRFTAERAFAGAEARGDALVVDGKTVLTCERVSVGPDRVEGRVEGATLRVKERPRLDARGVPQGRDASILTGDIERPSKDQLVIHDGSFTLCDCGGDPPSWRIDAGEIDVDLDDRALIWWPMLYINPFGLGLVPVTPPLLPVSIPLKARAAGFLPPAVTFFGPYPMIDLPLFVPLGQSWDVTLSAGLRTDWIRNHDISPARWGAPRAGARLRYAPFDGLQGELRAQWTWDRRLYVARQYFRQNDASADITLAELEIARATTDAERRAAEAKRDRLLLRQERVQAQSDALAEAEHRVTVDWELSLRLGDSLLWLVDVEWLSDDNIRRDFALSLTEQVVNYVPSRSQILWAPHDLGMGLAAGLAADYLLEIGNGDPEIVNTRGAELHSRHRGPALRLSLLPSEPLPDLLPGFVVDADAVLNRYGSWDPSDTAELWVTGAEGGVGYRDRVGPIELAARASGHVLWARGTEATDIQESLIGFLLLEASAESTWARRYGDVVHTITPRLAYAGVPARRRSNPAVARDLRSRPDEHLDVELFQQLRLGVDQALWRAGPRPKEIAALSLSVPLELAPPATLGLEAALRWQTDWLGRGRAWVVVDPEATTEGLEEVGVEASLPLGPVTLGASYIRFAPTAERFTRSVYALAGRAPNAIAEPGDWVHAITPSAAVRWAGATLWYRPITLLPLPGDTTSDPARPVVSRHVVGASYVSSCNCWSLGLQAQIPGYGTEQQVLDGMRVLVQLSVGGYAVGNRY